MNKCGILLVIGIMAETSFAVSTSEETTNMVKAFEIKVSQDGPVRHLKYFDRGRHIVADSQGTNVVMVDVEAQVVTNTFYVPEPSIQVIAVNEAKHLIAAASQMLCIWNPASEVPRKRLSEPRDRVECLSFSNEGKYLLSGGRDFQVMLWNTDEKKRLLTFFGCTGFVSSVGFVPATNLAYSTSYDGSIRLWNLSNGKCMGAWPVHVGQIESAAISLDGRLLASAGWDRKIVIWDVAKRLKVKELPIAADFAVVFSLAFSPDGKQLASGDSIGSILLWDAVEWKLLEDIRPQHGRINDLDFSPDSKSLATSTWDGTIVVYRKPEKQDDRGKSLMPPPTKTVPVQPTTTVSKP